ncbi:hypothetical protein [Pleomorphomonas carboxyditropha]|uniref:hypothetical protein n=1 Tax=Pleomorphomonas carboxyditropha TaxID=2023338 RepID=UPI0013FDF4F4|nr:hypothetical protein [Pleomorphomonas carboxyditropha]
MRTAAASPERYEFMPQEHNRSQFSQDLARPAGAIQNKIPYAVKLKVDYLAQNLYPIAHRYFLAELWLRRVWHRVLSESSL